MITRKKFYMIRHGQSIANEKQFFSGNVDVPLTDLGRQQAEIARAQVEALEEKPVHIIHSHLQRARHTAEIINQNLKLPMSQTNLVGEHHFGDWEHKPWDDLRPAFHAGENPPNGETHDEFMLRIQRGLNWALEIDGPVLIACHGGVFRAFYRLFNNSNNFKSTENCVLHCFNPIDNEIFPWEIKSV